MSTIGFGRARLAPLPPEIAKKLPANEEAERNILGGILLDNKSLKSVRDVLIAADFSVTQNQKIFLHMVTMADAGRPIDLTMLVEELSNNGQLEAAGGIGYLAGLSDGVPKVANIRFYAEIVKEKSRLRDLIYLTQNVQHKAIEGYTKTDELAAEFANFAKQSHTGENPAVVVGFESLLKRECAPVEYAIEPLLGSRGTGEIFSWRGEGKSYITTQMAVDMAKGNPVMFGGHRGAGGHWPISRPYRVLYVYGEMNDSEIKDRAINLAKMCGPRRPTDEQLGTMCKDFQKDWRPKISTPRDRKFIEDRIFSYGYEGLILDNISTLWPSAQDKQSDRSAELSEWYTDLNQRGIWVIFLHHAGKSGEQRGDSEKEDMLDFVIKLRKPQSKQSGEQLRVELHVDKHRHKATNARMLMPFEIQLAKNQNTGDDEWLTRPAQRAQMEAAFEMFKDGMPAMIAAAEVGVSKATIYRYKQLFNENKNVEYHLGPDRDPEE